MAERLAEQGLQDPTRHRLIGAREVETIRPHRVIMLCVPTTDFVTTSFAHDLTAAVAYHMANSEDRIILNMARGTVLAKTRETMAKEALKEGADWTVWLDSDMRFPVDTIGRLLEGEHRVVTVNAPKRKEPIGFTAHVFNEETKKMEVLQNEPSEDVVQIDTCGFAVAAIKVDVFEEVGKPWFWNPYVVETEQFVGEDIYFSSQLRKAGIPLMCDLELSEEVGHTGLKDYYLEDARMWTEILGKEKET